MAAIAEATVVTPPGMRDICVKVLTRLEAAGRSALNAAWIAAGAYLLTNEAAILASIGNGSDRPDFQTLEGIGQGAAVAAVAGALMFAFRYIKPKTTVAAK